MDVISGSHNEVVELDAAQSTDLFDRIARAYMSMPGAEFLRRWDAGDFVGTDWDAVPGLTEVALALPFAGRPAE